MAEERLPDEFKEFLSFLNLNKVKYLLIGGWAVGIYGNPRITKDIDFLIGTDQKNLDRIIATLEQFGLKGAPKEFFRVEGNTFRMGRSPLKIEILTKALGVEFEECYKRKKVIIIDGVRVKVISKDDLIISKLAANRFQDLADVEQLRRLK